MEDLDEYIAEVEAGFPLTYTPTLVPEIGDKTVSRVVCSTIDSYDQVWAFVGAEGKQYAHEESIAFIQEHLDWFYEVDGTKVTIPNNVLAVSFALPGFAVGVSFQDFYPICKDLPVDAFYTYRMLSKQCQATFFNSGGNEFLAGFCYYVQSKDSELLTTEVDQAVMGVTTGGNIPWPLVNRWNTWRFVTHRKYGRDCKTAGKRVQVKLEEGKEAVHQVFNYRTMEYEFEECEECKQEAKTYKFEETESAAGTPIEDKFEHLKVDEDTTSDDSDWSYVE